jgi:hypothetical protein
MVEWLLARGTEETQGKIWCSVLRRPRISHEVTLDWTRASVVRSRRLTAWAIWHGLIVMNEIATDVYRIIISVTLVTRRPYSAFKETKMWYHWYSLYFHVIHSVAINLENSYFFCCGDSSVMKTINDCRIWGSHSGGYEEYDLLGYNAV